jgi:hypothetical protein
MNAFIRQRMADANLATIHARVASSQSMVHQLATQTQGHDRVQWSLQVRL